MSMRYAVSTNTLVGVEAVPVTVEVDIGPGLPGFQIVGMPDTAVIEARERVRSALRSCGYTLPNSRVVVNLFPGSLKKTGSGFDLPIAVALLCALQEITCEWTNKALIVGELSLEGQVKPVRGLLAYALAARKEKKTLVCAPSSELSSLEGVTCCCLMDLAALRKGPPNLVPQTQEFDLALSAEDFCDIVGEDMAKRALQIAAAGRHGLLMIGPPGSGKTMLARRLPTILPALDEYEMCESALIHSVAGLPTSPLFAGVRPFRAPHHGASLAGLIGGGNPVQPGEVSLAHNGVLFLDEMPQFAASALQALRQPLEEGTVTIVRAGCHVRFPASFMLIAAANPCPCGFLGDAEKPCTCTSTQVSQYMNRIGGPLMDRIDLVVDVWRTDPHNVLETGEGTSSAALREKILDARQRATERAQRRQSTSLKQDRLLIEGCGLSSRDKRWFEDMARRSHLSGRGVMRTLRVARTIADLEASEAVGQQHLLEALAYRVREG